MNSVDIERFLRHRVRNFDVIFSVDTLPSMPRLLVCNRSFAHAGLTVDLHIC